MKGLDNYLLPYIISQIVALAILFVSWERPRLSRYLFVVLFIYAGCYNMYIGLVKPDEYLDFAKLSLPFYTRIINGWFSHYNHIIIPLIAILQLMIGIAMGLKGTWVKIACIGAIIFFISISPLMVGSAFPFPLIVSAAAVSILMNDKHDHLWIKQPPGLKTNKV